eukprot:42294-Rhodomonas_salina.3
MDTARSSWVKAVGIWIQVEDSGCRVEIGPAFCRTCPSFRRRNGACSRSKCAARWALVEPSPAASTPETCAPRASQPSVTLCGNETNQVTGTTARASAWAHWGRKQYLRVGNQEVVSSMKRRKKRKERFFETRGAVEYTSVKRSRMIIFPCGTPCQKHLNERHAWIRWRQCNTTHCKSNMSRHTTPIRRGQQQQAELEAALAHSTSN